jgi:transposase InsO family protein
VFQRRPRKGELIFHSDQGSQYASEDFRHVLDNHSIRASMSRKGNCWDNAVTETLFGSLKVERLHGERFQNTCFAISIRISFAIRFSGFWRRFPSNCRVWCYRRQDASPFV